VRVYACRSTYKEKVYKHSGSKYPRQFLSRNRRTAVQKDLRAESQEFVNYLSSFEK